MKLLLLTLLLLLCSTQVFTLTCYTCMDSTDTTCMEPEGCSSENDWCKTVEQNGLITSRGCAASCDVDDSTSCCQEDLC